MESPVTEHTLHTGTFLRTMTHVPYESRPLSKVQGVLDREEGNHDLEGDWTNAGMNTDDLMAANGVHS